MTTVTIKSNSDKKTLLLMQLAEELGLYAEAQDIENLDVNAMVKSGTVIIPTTGRNGRKPRNNCYSAEPSDG